MKFLNQLSSLEALLIVSILIIGLALITALLYVLVESINEGKRLENNLNK